jgi:MSHA biogenesis protein MshO
MKRTEQLGFTLFEAIVVIVITGIVAAMIAVFIRAPIDGYLDTATRADLTDEADTALRGMAREVRTALPNSIRLTAGASASCFEFLPTVGGGRYRIARSNAATGDILDFTAPDGSFDVLASANLPPAGGYGAAAYHAVVYNLGIPGSDAYSVGGLNRDNRADITAASGATNIVLQPPNLFPYESPSNRFQVIPDYSVIYSCSGTNLLRSTRAITAALLAACPATGTTIVGDVDCTRSAFTYQAAEQRSGLLTMTLVLSKPSARGVESISLYEEVHIDNTP